MTKRTIFMLVNNIDVNKGGINSVVFSRTHLFNNEKYTSNILTLDDKTNYPEIEEQLKEDGRLEKSSRIINVYEYYRNKFMQDGRVNEEMRKHYEKNMQREEEGYHYQLEGNVARYFENGRYVKYKRWDNDGKLFVVDYFSSIRVRSSREEYHPDGYLVKKLTYHPTNNKVTQIHYYTKEGFCYLSTWYNHQTEKVQRVVLFSPDKQNAKMFLNNVEFHCYFLEELCRTQELSPIIICDGPGSSVKLQKIDRNLAIRIYILHTNHLVAPYQIGGEVKKGIAQVLKNEDEFAPIVVLTNHQKIDIETQFSDRKWNLHVISHAVEPQSESVKKQDNLVVYVGRLSQEKRVSALIEAFKKVNEELPDARLDIYGDGPEKAELQKLVKTLKLTKAVKFKGYTTDARSKLAEALFSVNTSVNEGQGLVMLEGMAERTPTLAFNINYIVREIASQEAGKTVENGNVEAMAEAMIDWLYKPEEVKKLGDKALDIIRKNYSVANYYRQWDQLFDEEIRRQQNLKD
ncbi:MAG: glycosyltransferase [Kurthia sp.]|nr:glycosyltransferase [Candidatus Kurthia equi]